MSDAEDRESKSSLPAILWTLLVIVMLLAGLVVFGAIQMQSHMEKEMRKQMPDLRKSLHNFSAAIEAYVTDQPQYDPTNGTREP